MNKYKDIINLPHKQSTRRAHMPLLDRAAQFAPYAAFTGLDDAIKETGRQTDEQVILSEESLNELNRRYQVLAESIGEDNEIQVTYFVPDATKKGGSYISARGIVKKVDEAEHLILLRDGTKIPMENILFLEGTIFSSIYLP